MIRKQFLASAVALCALTFAPPLAAQDAGEDVDMATAEPAKGDPMQDAMDMFGKMFPAEPLTADQQARLPQATRIVARILPEGTLGDMMGTMFDKMLGPMMAATDAPASATVQKGLGISAASAGLNEEQTAEIAALLDPAYAERHAREMAVMPAVMRDLMTAMEPTMRTAMSELYAIHFTPKELDDIEVFFQTDSGTAYARKSFTMSSDPRILSATMQAMPQMMGALGDMEKKIAAASADLPPKRSFADLSGADKAKIAKLTGYSIADIEAALAETSGETGID